MWYKEIGVCAHNIDTDLGSIINTIWEAICDHQKRKRIFTFTTSYSCISTPIMKLKLILFGDPQLLIK